MEVYGVVGNAVGKIRVVMLVVDYVVAECVGVMKENLWFERIKVRDNKNKCSVEQGKESIVAATMEKGF